MTPRMHLSPAARTANAALLTTLLVVSPAVAPATAHPPGQSGHSGTPHVAHSDTSAQLEGSGQDEADRSLGGDSDTKLAASQEGKWFLGQSVDSVLGPGQWYMAEQGRTWYGAYRTFPDEFAYCVDAGLKTPHTRHFDDDQEGESIASAQSAWALDAHAQSDSSHVQAALSALVRLDEDIPHRHQIPSGHPADLGADFADAAAEFATIEKDADLFAGPYTLSVDIRVRTFRALDGQYGPPLRDAAKGDDHPSSDDGEMLTARFPVEAVVSLTSASGEPMTGHRVNLSATGSRTAVDSVVTAEEPTVVALTDVDADRITVDAATADLPATSVELHRPRGLGSDRVQAVVTAGEPTKATAQAVYDRPPQPEETDPPRVEVPNPQPTTLPTPTATPEPPAPTTTPAPPEEPSEDPSEEPSEEPEEKPTTAPPSPAETPETPPTPDVPETPEASESPDSTPEAPETAEALETPEAPEPSAAPEQPNEAPSDASEDEPLPASLPRTGADSMMALGLAITLIAVGVAALTFTRRG